MFSKLFRTRELTAKEQDHFPGNNHADIAIETEDGTEYYGENDYQADGTPNPQFINNEDGEHVEVKK